MTDIQGAAGEQWRSVHDPDDKRAFVHAIGARPDGGTYLLGPFPIAFADSVVTDHNDRAARDWQKLVEAEQANTAEAMRQLAARDAELADLKGKLAEVVARLTQEAEYREQMADAPTDESWSAQTNEVYERLFRDFADFCRATLARLDAAVPASQEETT